MGMRGCTCGLYHNPVACIAGGILVVCFRGCFDCGGAVLHAPLLTGKGEADVRVIVFRLPKFLAKIVSLFQWDE